MVTEYTTMSQNTQKLTSVIECFPVLPTYVLSLSLPQREIGVKLTYGPVGVAPMSIPAFKFSKRTLKLSLSLCLPLCCGHIVKVDRL